MPVTCPSLDIRTLVRPKPLGLVNLAQRPSEELVDHLLNPNEWYVRHARRLHAEGVRFTGQSPRE